MKDGKGNELQVGDRVETFDFGGGMVAGTLLKNDEYPHVSEYYVKYDDGEECAVLDPEMLFKIEGE